MFPRCPADRWRESMMELHTATFTPWPSVPIVRHATYCTCRSEACIRYMEFSHLFVDPAICAVPPSDVASGAIWRRDWSINTRREEFRAHKI